MRLRKPHFDKFDAILLPIVPLTLLALAMVFGMLWSECRHP